MQDQKPSEPSGAGDWLEGLRSQLGSNAETIAAALDDVAAMRSGESIPVGWVDVRKDPHLTVYVLDGGIVYILSGERDRRPDPKKLGESADTRCSLRLVPITSDAACSTTIVRTVPFMGAGDPVVTRWWGLRFGDQADEDLALGSPPDPNAYPRGADPAPFARALIAEIARVKAAAPLGGDA